MISQYHEFYLIFALAALPAAIYMKLWKNSVSTFLFVLAIAWIAWVIPECHFVAETKLFGPVFLLELIAMVRAARKAPNDKLIPSPKEPKVC